MAFLELLLVRCGFCGGRNSWRFSLSSIVMGLLIRPISGICPICGGERGEDGEHWNYEFGKKSFGNCFGAIDGDCFLLLKYHLFIKYVPISIHLR